MECRTLRSGGWSAEDVFEEKFQLDGVGAAEGGLLGESRVTGAMEDCGQGGEHRRKEGREVGLTGELGESRIRFSKVAGTESPGNE